MFGLGTTEVVAILVIALIFIGPKKLPGLAQGIGKAIKEFQDAFKGSGIKEQVQEIKESVKLDSDSQSTHQAPSQEAKPLDQVTETIKVTESKEEKPE